MVSESRDFAFHSDDNFLTTNTLSAGANAWIHQRDFKTPNKNGCN